MFGRNDFLGEVTMALENKVFDEPMPRFYTLQERVSTSLVLFILCDVSVTFATIRMKTCVHTTHLSQMTVKQ